jgi:DNA-binding NarL/FixJ family response regulator
VATGVLIADDHALVCAAVRRILSDESDLVVVAEARDGAEAVRLAQSQDVGLCVLDISMPKLTGLQATRRILEYRPAMRVLLLSMHDSDELLFEALEAGAAGYLLKSSAETELVAACRTALAGHPFLHARALGVLVREHLEHERRNRRASGDALTARETEILKLVAEGHTSREIAQILSLSVNTVERHRHSLLTKLGLRDRVALTRYALRCGLVKP